jgi:hypothetical protein
MRTLRHKRKWPGKKTPASQRVTPSHTFCKMVEEKCGRGGADLSSWAAVVFGEAQTFATSPPNVR